MRRQLIVFLFVVSSFIFAGQAEADFGRLLNCGQPNEQAIYNAQVLAYKQRYTEAWQANFQRNYGRYGQAPVYRQQPVYNQRPVYYRSAPQVYYSVPTTTRTVVRTR